MNAIIQTHTGKMIDLLHPDPFLIDIYDIAHALAHICRFGGHSRQFYSIAQHSLMVSLVVPTGDALVGLMHDATEAYCGDVVSPLKHCLPALKDIEYGLWEAIAWRYRLPERLPASVDEADLQVLAAEQRDLHAVRLPWEGLRDVVPAGPRIHPMSTRAAYTTFLKQFKYLDTGRRNGKK